MGPTYSYTRLKRYEQCPLSYRLHYLDKEPSEPGDALRFGLVPHGALERTYKHIRATKHKGAFPIEHLLAAFAEEWARSGLTDYTAFEEGHQMLKAYAAAHTPVDYETVLAIEQEFRIVIDGIEVMGYMDRVDQIDSETAEI